MCTFGFFGHEDVFTTNTTTYERDQALPGLGLRAQEYINTINNNGKLPDGVSPEMVEWSLGQTTMADTALDEANGAAKGMVISTVVASAGTISRGLRTILNEAAEIRKAANGTVIAKMKNGKVYKFTADEAAELGQAMKNCGGCDDNPTGSALRAATVIQQNTSQIEFNGVRVWERRGLIDPQRIDSDTGMTNLELIQSGRPPFTNNGQRIELHHIAQREETPLMWSPANEHDLIPNPESSRIDRNRFNAFRRDYWMGFARRPSGQ